MKIHWLKDVIVQEVSYVNRPAIDKHFIAIKTMEDEDENKSFADKLGRKIKNKLGLVETKIGRVLSKSNEAKLLNAANDIVKAGETVKAVLMTVQKNNKKEGSEMEKKDVEKIVGDILKKELGTFKKDIEKKLDEILSDADEDEDEDDSEDEENEDEEDSKEDEDEDDSDDDDEEDEEDDSEDDSEDEEDDKEEKSKKDKKDKKSKKKSVSKKKSKDNLLTKISDMVEKKFKEVKSEIADVKKELKIKPESDKGKVNKKEVDKKEDDGDADYTGAFGIKV